MSFPNIPFKLNDGSQGDKTLLNYLQKNLDTFSYLRDKTKRIIEKLNISDEVVKFPAFHAELIKLWPEILTDVLLKLKSKDSREWDNKNPNMHTFFDEQSLGTAELREVLTGFFEFEGMMYGASPDRYRDHVAHSFRVWIIGHAILKECLQNNLETCEDKSLRIHPIEQECMWAITALCHDIGYPLSVIEKINQKARDTLRKQGLRPEGDLRFTFSQQMLPFHDAIIKLMSSKPIRKSLKTKGGKNQKEHEYLTHLQNKYYLKFLKSFDSLDHGIISSLLISGSLVYFLESDLSHDSWKSLDEEDARQFLIRREILRAISAHTCQDIYHLHFNTLSFLLYIVDEIQCWGRPTFEQLQHKTGDIGEAYVEVKKISKDSIDVTITAWDDEKWNRQQLKIVAEQVGKLRKMLRLAVETPKLQEAYLRFEIRNKRKQGHFLELKDGKVTFKPLE